MADQTILDFLKSIKGHVHGAYAKEFKDKKERAARNSRSAMRNKRRHKKFLETEKAKLEGL